MLTRLTTPLRSALGRLLPRRAAPHLPRLDLRGQTIAPEELADRIARQSVLVDLDAADCRLMHLLAFPATPESGHPLIATTRGLIAGNVTGYDGSPLARWFDRIRPQSAAEVLDLNLPAGHALRAMPANQAQLPWAGLSGPKVAAVRVNRKADESRDPHAPFHVFGGPYPRTDGIARVTRLAGLIDAIRREGYSPERHDNFMTAEMLVGADGRAAFRIMGGQHRTSTLVALGITRFAVHIKAGRVRRLRDAANWPAPRAGALSLEQAQTVFRRMLQGGQPGYVRAHWPGAEE